jgi:O-antigen/teichoic acid export membrane protein
VKPLAAEQTGLVTPLPAAEPRSAPLMQRLAHGSVWSLTGSLATQVAAMLFSVLAARLLAPASFGQLGLIQATIGAFSVFTGIGLGLTTTRYLAALWRTEPARAGRILAMTETVVLAASFSIGAVVLLVAPAVAGSILGAPQLATPLRLAVGFLLFSSMNAVESGALAGLEAFPTLARNNLLYSGLTLTAASGGVWLGGISGAMAGLALAQGCLWLANRAAVRTECRLRGIDPGQRVQWGEGGIFTGFTVPAILSTALLTPVIWAATTILARGEGGYAEVGLFTIAHQWRAVTVFLSNIISQPMLAMLPGLYECGDAPGFRRLLQASIWLNVATGAGAGLAIVAAANWIAAFYGPGFLAAEKPMRLLILASVLNCYTSALVNALASIQRMWRATALNAIWATALLVSAALLAPSRGATGLALSFLFSYLVLAVVSTAAAWKPLWKWRGEPGS